MLSRLARGPASVNELAEPFDVSLQSISKHLKVLERAGLVMRGRDAQRRPARLIGAGLEEASQWLVGYREFFTESYERLDDIFEIQDQGRRQP